MVEGKTVTTDHPVAYVSGLFRGSQLNWAALTKEDRGKKIEEMYAKLKGAKFFLTIDLRSGYYHIALGKDLRAKTAFVSPFGKYKFLQVPFGLAQAPAFFQHLMNKVLDNCPFAMTYLDDIIIFSDTEEEHLAHIKEIFKRLEAADLKMKRSKCDFFKKHIHYLGHLISADGI